MTNTNGITTVLKDLQNSIDKQTIILEKILEQQTASSQVILSQIRTKDRQKLLNNVQEYLNSFK